MAKVPASGARSIVICVVLLAHAGIVYELAHSRARATLDGPPLFRPAIARSSGPTSQDAIRSRQSQPAIETSTNRLRVWGFPNPSNCRMAMGASSRRIWLNDLLRALR
jgi:hypothetical protein